MQSLVLTAGTEPTAVIETRLAARAVARGDVLFRQHGPGFAGREASNTECFVHALALLFDEAGAVALKPHPALEARSRTARRLQALWPVIGELTTVGHDTRDCLVDVVGHWA